MALAPPSSMPSPRVPFSLPPLRAGLEMGLLLMGDPGKAASGAEAAIGATGEVGALGARAAAASRGGSRGAKAGPADEAVAVVPREPEPEPSEPEPRDDPPEGDDDGWSDLDSTVVAPEASVSSSPPPPPPQPPLPPVAGKPRASVFLGPAWE